MIRAETKKVLVIGCGGAGKSSLSRRLGEVLDLPVVHLDAHYWKPDWRETPAEEWERKVAELAGRDEWVMDGNYGGTMDIRLARAEIVVFLDMPRSLCLWRVVARRLRHARRSRPDMAPGCPERLEWQFLKYVWNYRKTRRPRVLEKLENLPPEKRVFVLRSPDEVRRFLREAQSVSAFRSFGSIE